MRLLPLCIVIFWPESKIASFSSSSLWGSLCVGFCRKKFVFFANSPVSNLACVQRAEHASSFRLLVFSRLATRSFTSDCLYLTWCCVKVRHYNIFSSSTLPAHVCLWHSSHSSFMLSSSPASTPYLSSSVLTFLFSNTFLHPVFFFYALHVCLFLSSSVLSLHPTKLHLILGSVTLTAETNFFARGFGFSSHLSLRRCGMQTSQENKAYWTSTHSPAYTRRSFINCAVCQVDWRSL